MKIREEFGGRGNDREILGYTKQITLNNKIKALEMLAKHLNLFEEIGDDDRPFTVKVIYEEAQKGKAV